MGIGTLSEKGECRALLQSMAFAATQADAKDGDVVCHTPHLMGIDHNSGDVYLACVAVPGSNVVRLRQHAGHQRNTNAIMYLCVCAVLAIAMLAFTIGSCK